MNAEDDDSLWELSNEELEKMEQRALAMSAELRQAKAMASTSQAAGDGEQMGSRGYRVEREVVDVIGCCPSRGAHAASSGSPATTAVGGGRRGRDGAMSLSIHVLPYGNDRYAVEFHYDENLVRAVRTIPGRYWDSQKRVWSFPMEQLGEVVKVMSNTLPNLQADFTFDPSIALPPDIAAVRKSPSSMSCSIPRAQNPIPPAPPPSFISNNNNNPFYHPALPSHQQQIVSSEKPPSPALSAAAVNNSSHLTPLPFHHQHARASENNASSCTSSSGTNSNGGPGMKSITVQLKVVGGDRFAAKSAYYPKLKDACKSVPQSMWDAQGRVWTFPTSKLAILVDTLRRIPSTNVVLEAVAPLSLPPVTSSSTHPRPSAASAGDDPTTRHSMSADAAAQWTPNGDSSSSAANAASSNRGGPGEVYPAAAGATERPEDGQSLDAARPSSTAVGEEQKHRLESMPEFLPFPCHRPPPSPPPHPTPPAYHHHQAPSANSNSRIGGGGGVTKEKATNERSSVQQRLSPGLQDHQRQHPPPHDLQHQRQQHPSPLQDPPQHHRQHPPPHDPQHQQQTRPPAHDPQIQRQQTAPAAKRIKTVKLSPYAEGRIGLKFDYDDALVRAVKSIPSATWIGSERLWIIPADKLEDARKAFAALSSSAGPTGCASASSWSSSSEVLVKMESLPALVQRALEATCAAHNDEEAFYSNSMPSKLREALLPFQEEGVKFALRRGGRTLIGDEMGLGKTLQAIAVAACYRSEWPVLVIVPSSLRLYWASMLVQWLDIKPAEITVVMPTKTRREEGFTVVTSLGSSHSTLRQRLWEEGEAGLFVIVSYDIVSKIGLEGLGMAAAAGEDNAAAEENWIGASALTSSHGHPSPQYQEKQQQHPAQSSQFFNVVIADESHYLKNRNAKRTMACVPLIQRAARAILLTGTPALSRPIELLKQLEALQPTVYRNSFQEYGSRYCMGSPFGVFQGSSNMEELHALVKSTVMIRRLKNDVMKQLPPKRRQQVFLSMEEKELAQLKAIQKQLDEVSARMKRASGEELELMRFDRQNLLNKLYVESAKAKVPSVQEYVGLLLDADCKFLIFAHHMELLDGISDVLRKKRVDFIRIDGHTPVTDRQYAVSKFQNDRQTRVAVLGIRAAGVGLTLTAASIVVFAEMSWTPGDLVQAEDRAHRIGQEGSSVNVYYLHGKNTIDDIMWDTVQHKLDKLGQVLDGRTEGGRLELAGGTVSMNPRGQTAINKFFNKMNPAVAAAAAAAGGGGEGGGGGDGEVTPAKPADSFNAFLMAKLAKRSATTSESSSPEEGGEGGEGGGGGEASTEPFTFNAMQERHGGGEGEGYVVDHDDNDDELTATVVGGVSDCKGGDNRSRDDHFDPSMTSLRVEPEGTGLWEGGLRTASERASHGGRSDGGHTDQVLEPPPLSSSFVEVGCGGGRGMTASAISGRSRSRDFLSSGKDSTVPENCNAYHHNVSCSPSSPSGGDSPQEMDMRKAKKLQRLA